MRTIRILGMATLALMGSLRAEDVVLVEGGVTAINGVDPTTAPTANQVLIGGGQIRLGQAGQASGDQAVRGDDPRLNGNGTTFATLVDGKIPISQLPVGIGNSGVGGSGSDGALTDATVLPATVGHFDFSSIQLSTTKNLPPISYIRIYGNVVLSTTISVNFVAGDIANEECVRVFDAISGNNGTNHNVGSGGGAHFGAGGSYGSGYGGAAQTAPTAIRFWLSRRPMIGGRGGFVDNHTLTGWGGGSLRLVIDGNLDMSGGGVISANGRTGGMASNDSAGGGAGGSVVVFCTGTITGGTFTANGGAGADGSGENGGGGGGGYVAIIANAYAGTQTLTATGGFGPNTATDGGVGLTTKVTMSAADIRALVPIK